jgi:ribosomal protein L32E
MVTGKAASRRNTRRYSCEVHVWFRSKRVELREVGRPRGLLDKVEDKMAESTAMLSQSMATPVSVREIHKQKTRPLLLIKFMCRER